MEIISKKAAFETINLPAYSSVVWEWRVLAFIKPSLVITTCDLWSTHQTSFSSPICIAQYHITLTARFTGHNLSHCYFFPVVSIHETIFFLFLFFILLQTTWVIYRIINSPINYLHISAHSHPRDIARKDWYNKKEKRAWKTTSDTCKMHFGAWHHLWQSFKWTISPVTKHRCYTFSWEFWLCGSCVSWFSQKCLLSQSKQRASKQTREVWWQQQIYWKCVGHSESAKETFWQLGWYYNQCWTWETWVQNSTYKASGLFWAQCISYRNTWRKVF